MLSLPGFFKRITLITLGVFALNLSVNAQAPNNDIKSLCGPVMGGAVNFLAWECWNDSIFQVVDTDKFSQSGWQYTVDGGVNDFAGPGFDICGMGFRETKDEVWVTVNSGQSIEAPYLDVNALGGLVTFGDLFINLSGLDFGPASNQGKLFAVRFAALNDSGTAPLGVYGAVTAKSVVSVNSGPNNRQGYENHIYAYQGIPGYGDLPINNTYYAMDLGLNVIDHGTYLGALSFVDSSTLASSGYNPANFGCPYTVAFKFKKNLIIDDCGVIGGDGSSCRDCAGISCGHTGTDLCGVCGGDGTSCLDCAGTAFGTASVDRCGVCGGDGFSCCHCTESDISKLLDDLRSTTLAQYKHNLKLIVKKLKGNKKLRVKFIFSNQALFNKLQALIDSIPSMAKECAETQFCVKVNDNQTKITQYTKIARSLSKLSGKIPSSSGPGVCKRTAAECRASALDSRGRKLLQDNLKHSGKIPGQTSVCS